MKPKTEIIDANIASATATHRPEFATAISRLRRTSGSSLVPNTKDRHERPPGTDRPVSILRLRAVLAKLGISRTGLYERIKRGDFPRQIQLGPKAVGWLQHEVEAWLEQRIEISRPSSGSQS